MLDAALIAVTLSIERSNALPTLPRSLGRLGRSGTAVALVAPGERLEAEVEDAV
jgi:hypothetical protein